MSDIPERYRDLPRFAFGDGPALADELLDLVIAGRKTATCMTADDPNRTRVGQRWIRVYFGRLGTFEEDMTLVCERFHLVEVLRGPGARA